MPTTHELLEVVRRLRCRAADSLTLDQLARQSGWSAFHLHRDFRAVVGETPKQYSLRLRLDRAAAQLISSDTSVLDIAVAAGFQSHEVFTRAFRRRFGMTPARYRVRAPAPGSADALAQHLAIVETAGPCVGLFQVSLNQPHRRLQMPTLSIEHREIPEQPVLIVRLRAARHELSTAIGEGLGKAFPYSQQAGLAVAGRPFTRYLTTGPGLFHIEVGLPVAGAAIGKDDVEAGALPGGRVAVAMHGGAYDQLSETYAALERWIDANGFRVSGAPWESYLTDPADHPDPVEWRTEVFWPIEKI